MGTREEAASSKEDGETGLTSERRSKHAQWDALDRPQRSAVAGIARGVWPLAVLCTHDLLNGGMMVPWRPYFAHCPQMRIWKT